MGGVDGEVGGLGLGLAGGDERSASASAARRAARFGPVSGARSSQASSDMRATIHPASARTGAGGDRLARVATLGPRGVAVAEDGVQHDGVVGGVEPRRETSKWWPRARAAYAAAAAG